MSEGEPFPATFVRLLDATNAVAADALALSLSERTGYTPTERTALAALACSLYLVSKLAYQCDGPAVFWRELIAGAMVESESLVAGPDAPRFRGAA